MRLCRWCGRRRPVDRARLCATCDIVVKATENPAAVATGEALLAQWNAESPNSSPTAPIVYIPGETRTDFLIRAQGAYVTRLDRLAEAFRAETT